MQQQKPKLSAREAHQRLFFEPLRHFIAYGDDKSETTLFALIQNEQNTEIKHEWAGKFVNALRARGKFDEAILAAEHASPQKQEALINTFLDNKQYALAQTAISILRSVPRCTVRRVNNVISASGVVRSTK